MFPPMTTSESRGITRVRLRRRFADPPSSCGVLSDTSRSPHREVCARRCKHLREGVIFSRFLAVPCRMTRARLDRQGGYPAEDWSTSRTDIPRSFARSAACAVVR
jgi:hypothetical protein